MSSFSNFLSLYNPHAYPGLPSRMDKKDNMKYCEVLTWYKSTVENLVKDGTLNGTGDSALNVSEEFCRGMTVMDRLGKLD